jgi:glutamyl-tRNA(Gln) amidotransferase subunit E
MYPETDVPPVLVTAERLDWLRDHLPERPAALRERLVRTYHLPAEVVGQLVSGGDVGLLETLVRLGRAPGLTARLLTQDLPAVSVASAAIAAPELSVERLDELLAAAEAGEFAKEGIPAVLAALVAGAPDLAAALEHAGLAGAGVDDLDAVVDRIVRANAKLVRERGDAAFSPLMGDVMREVRGRRDGREVAESLRRSIARLRAEPGP